MRIAGLAVALLAAVGETRNGWCVLRIPYWFALSRMLLFASPVAHAAALTGGPVYTFDASGLRKVDLKDPAAVRRTWDALHLLTAVQGLANRDAPRFYIFYCEEFGVQTDRFWFDWFRKDDGWLKDVEVKELRDLDAVIGQFRDLFRGLVVYDERVPSTSNLASTAAGIEGLLPVRFDAASNSLAMHLAADLKVPVGLTMLNQDGSPRFSGGSPKTAAYRWAEQRYLKTVAAGRDAAAHYIDAYWLRKPDAAGPEMHTLVNHDWFIARKAFFFDLSPWGDEAPVDEPEQVAGTDRRTLLDILRSMSARAGRDKFIKIGGFPPWPFKYTTHGGAGRHEPVPTEWEFARLVTQFNGYMEADAAGLGAMANASFFAHYPLPARMPQPNAKPTAADWQARGFLGADGRVAGRFFVAHYVGDYDAPSWLYKAVPVFFRDPTRGQVPLGWAFNPNLADRAPQALAYAWRNATTNDFFVAGNSGAGYVNPRALTVRPESNAQPVLKAWEMHCRKYYERWGLTLTGFLLDGAAGASTDAEFMAYRGVSPDGIGTHYEKTPAIRLGVPTCPERDLPDGAAEAAALIAARAKEAGPGPGFLWARSILKPPSWYAEVSRVLRDKHGELPVEVVDPFTLFGLIRRHYSKAAERE